MFLKQLNALKFELNTFHFLEVFNKKNQPKITIYIYIKALIFTFISIARSKNS